MEDKHDTEYELLKYLPRRQKSNSNSRADWASTTVCCFSDSENEEDEVKANKTVHNDIPSAKEGIDLEKDSFAENKCEEERILEAAQKNEVHVVRGMLERNASLINAIDSDSYTPLHRSCYSNHTEVIKVLLSYGADVSAKTCDSREPLHCACQWDCVDAASLLLQNGANVNALTSGKLSPLHLASANPKARRTLELLLWQPYIDITLRSEANDTAYDTAQRSSPYAALFEITEESINVY